MSKASESLENKMNDYFESEKSKDEFAPLDTALSILQGPEIAKVLAEHKRFETNLGRLKKLLTERDDIELVADLDEIICEIVEESLIV